MIGLIVSLRDCNIDERDVVSVERIAGVHRNHVWLLHRNRGMPDLVLKLQAAHTGYQTVAHEADALAQIGPGPGIPRLIGAGKAGKPERPFVLTEAIHGVPLADLLNEDRVITARQLTGHAEWLHDFAAASGPRALLGRKASEFHGPWAIDYCPPGVSPFSFRKSVYGRGLTGGHKWPVVVHGSFDPKNILVVDERDATFRGAVDFEATRLGSPLIDIAGLALHFLIWRRPGLAARWLSVAATVWRWPTLPADAMPYLLAQHERRRRAGSETPNAPMDLVDDLVRRSVRDGRWS